MVYNRSEKGLEGFKKYAKEHELDEKAYKVVKDLKDIGKTQVTPRVLGNLSNTQCGYYSDQFGQ